ncbi:hypothetical protein ANN_18330 [Periplaneta americana]|uniref:Uncharacterized protein n=1 Tax=Periplaneta americana TaxID=6978 RepID=A0ABQ8SNG5_PERAM|nr:hypothetical protein ANN_18330 [Periplaneta americana]
MQSLGGNLDLVTPLVSSQKSKEKVSRNNHSHEITNVYDILYVLMLYPLSHTGYHPGVGQNRLRLSSNSWVPSSGRLLHYGIDVYERGFSKLRPWRISPERQWQFFASCFPIVSFQDLVMFHGSLGPLTCPRDFFLCEYLKARVYEDKPRILDELKDTKSTLAWTPRPGTLGITPELKLAHSPCYSFGYDVWINFENETQDRQEWRNAICEREGKDSGFSYDLLDGVRTTFGGMVLRDQPGEYCRRNGRTYYEHCGILCIFEGRLHRDGVGSTLEILICRLESDEKFDVIQVHGWTTRAHKVLKNLEREKDRRSQLQQLQVVCSSLQNSSLSQCALAAHAGGHDIYSMI